MTFFDEHGCPPLTEVTRLHYGATAAPDEEELRGLAASEALVAAASVIPTFLLVVVPPSSAAVSRKCLVEPDWDIAGGPVHFHSTRPWFQICKVARSGTNVKIKGLL